MTKTMHRTKKDDNTETAFVVEVGSKDYGLRSADESICEIIALVNSAGAEVMGQEICFIDRITPSTYVGKGKIAEISKNANDLDVDMIVFNNALSPAQQRNIEKTCNLQILDRTSIILDIFAKRARSSEGKIQVELAQLNYLLPRLTRMWTHLSRLGAGIGTRGPGETQLEVDRRKIRQRIDSLRNELKKVKTRRRIQRRGRKRRGFTSIALVGYTNAGKSTLLNRLTGSSVEVMDQLFATLDPTIRLLKLPSNRNVTISDTVGFISNLPHQLIAAFKATLEEVVEADLIMHVIDASSDVRDFQIHEVNSLLKELKVDDKDRITVYNKVDLCPQIQPGLLQDSQGVEVVAVSAQSGEGINHLINVISDFENQNSKTVLLHIPYSKPKILAKIQKLGDVLNLEYKDGFIEVSANLKYEFIQRYQEYVVEDEKTNDH